MNPIDTTLKLGQSLWLDYIRRDLIETGELREMISDGLARGVTSNPSIFENAISSSDLYTRDIRAMAQSGWGAQKIFDHLAIDDIRGAADAFLRLYEQTNGGDGFVSIEVNPELADDTDRTISEARRLWSVVNRPNAMIKIPATAAGIPAIEEVISDGINVNVTLIFSLDRYNEVMEAYLRGLEHRLSAGGSLEFVASVASFFVSRVDTEVDRRLEEIVRKEGSEAERASALLGKAAIANAKLAYAQYEATFQSERFRALAEHGAKVQRPLWASTSTKNPAYPDTYYVDTLIGPDTVNTVPAKTLEAFRDHGNAELTITKDLSAARAQIEALEALDIQMEEVTDLLEREGVEKFVQSFQSLIGTLENRAGELQKELGSLQEAVEKTVLQLDENEVGRRLWSADTSLWTTDKEAAAEISDRLGWLNLPQDMVGSLEDLSEFAREIQNSGFDVAVLLGMGGSSLASDVMASTLGDDATIQFFVLDSTDPAAISAVARKAPAKRSLYIISSKSGTTVEPLALMEFFWARAERSVGENAGDHFIAITDPGSKLEEIAQNRSFRRVFSTPTSVGGRYSALTYFGLVPAALMELEPQGLIQGAQRMARACGPNLVAGENPGLQLGAVLGSAYADGRDKVTFIADPDVAPFAVWIEQLLAESSGKNGKGLNPIVGEPLVSSELYGSDRLLVYLRSEGSLDGKVAALSEGGVPIAIVEMEHSENGFGAAFFQWEFATAVACHLMGVNAFDQPNVQRAKDRTVDLLQEYEKKKVLPLPEILWEGDGLRIRGRRSSIAQDSDSLAAAMSSIIQHTQGRSAIALLLFLRENRTLSRKISEVRKSILGSLRIATIAEFGPRYLHSTGQFYKGGPDQAVYLLITSSPKQDLEIPGKDYTFGILEMAQAVGDQRALLDLGRPAFLIELDDANLAQEVFKALSQAAKQIA